jgi:hypothetical protein
MGWFPNKQERDAIDERQLSAGLRERQLAARRIPSWLRIVIVLPSAVLIVYFIATFSGPFRYAAELEAGVFGGTYHPQLAGLLTIIVCLLPPLLAVSVLRRVFPPTAEELARPPRATARTREP